MFKKLIHGIIIGILAAATAFALQSAGWLDWLEGPLWDVRVKFFKAPGKATDNIRLVFLDQTSLDWGKTEQLWAWPWPRQVYAPVINFCKRGGAKAVIFDVIFSEPSQLGIDDDKQLSSAIAQYGRFVTTVTLSNEQGTSTNWPAGFPVLKPGVKGISSSGAFGLDMSRAAFPIPEIATNSDVIGNVYTEADKDSSIRRIAPFRLFDGKFIPTLGLAAYLAGNPNSKLMLENHILFVDNHPLPLDSRGNTILRYRGPSQTHKTFNVSAVIQSELRLIEGGKPTIDPEIFRDCYVFFGFTASGLHDLKNTPVSPKYPGVEIHATLLDNILSDDLIRDTPILWNIIVAVLFAIAAGIAGRTCVTGWQTALVFLVLLPLPLLPGFTTYDKGFWFPAAVNEIAVALSLVCAVIVSYAIEGKQKRFIKTAFKQYVPTEVIERLVKDPEHLKLGGETKELSILFSDVQGFTTISESLTPQSLTSLLNEYLTAMTQIVYDEGGTIDKYEGDAIIAFWNAPLDVSDHAVRAVRAALKCGRKLTELRPQFRERVGKDIYARIGINTGPVVVGNMGSNQRFNYTFLGDAGNLASRLEGINKQFGTYVMISEFTNSRLGTDFAVRELSRVRVVGKAQPVRVFEPMFKEDYTAKEAVFNKFAQALKLYYDGKFKEALSLFTEISNSDQPAKAYAGKCEQLINNPPAQWDGVWAMTEK